MQIRRLWLAGMLMCGTARVWAATDVPATADNNVITGTMTFRYAVPTPATGPATTEPTTAIAPTFVNTCTFHLEVAKTTEFKGTIIDWGRRLSFAIDVGVANPKNLLQKKTVGRWAGDVPFDPASGVFELGDKKVEQPLKITIDAIAKAQASSDPFGGALWLGSQSGPIRTLRFDNVELAKGPAAIYLRTWVNGHIDYDPETATLTINGMKFGTANGAHQQTDQAIGAIRWTPDPDYPSNGRGTYAVNLAFTAFSPRTQPTSVPAIVTSLSGFVACVDRADPVSKRLLQRTLGIKLQASGLSKPQILNTFKAGLLGMMPLLQNG